MIFLILELPLHDRIKAIVKFGDETTIKRLISLLTIAIAVLLKILFIIYVNFVLIFHVF